METIIKLVEVLVPLIIETIKKIHPEKSDEDHKQIILEVITNALNHWHQQ